MQKSNNNEEEKRLSPLKTLRRILLHNWPWKLLSFFLALCLWGGLISQDSSLTREKVFNDVTINTVNYDALRRNGLIIVSGLDDLPAVRVKADVPQKVYGTVTAGNFNVRVDLSKITGTGKQTLQVIATSSTTYGTVTDISVEEVTVQVEDYVTRSRIPVRLMLSGEAPAGFYAESPSVDPAYVTVSGPKSLVNTVVRCVADYDLALLTPASGTERSAVPFHLVNMYDTPLDTALIEVTSESVLLDSLIVEQKLYKQKTLLVDATGITTGMPAQGYVIKSVSVEPSSVTVAGTDAAVDALNALILSEYLSAPIDVSGLNSTLRRSVRLEKPAGIVDIGSDTLLITVNIAAL